MLAISSQYTPPATPTTSNATSTKGVVAFNIALPPRAFAGMVSTMEIDLDADDEDDGFPACRSGSHAYPTSATGRPVAGSKRVADKCNSDSVHPSLLRGRMLLSINANPALASYSVEVSPSPSPTKSLVLII